MGIAGKALTFSLFAPEAVGKGKQYAKDQRLARGIQPTPPPVPPGPPMNKISARRALRGYLKKQAGSAPLMSARSLMRNIPAAMATSALVVGTGVGVSRGLGVIGGMYDRHRANRMFEELKNRYPEIRRSPKSREYFDMIMAYAPGLARHPVAIGDFLRRQLDYPMTSIEFVKQLADLETTLSKNESRADSFGREMAEGGSGLLTRIDPNTSFFGRGGVSS
jgi:hypothetical protein